MIYENPYILTGNIVKAGLKKRPKDICIDREIGTWKVDNVEVLINRWNGCREIEKYRKFDKKIYKWYNNS